jgi:hypothetical protein
MLNSTKTINLIGLFIKRKNIPNPTIQDLHKEILIYLFEAQTILMAIKHLTIKDFSIFDGHVGDAKCQTRTSMLIDMYSPKNRIFEELNSIQKNTQLFIQKIQQFLQENNFDNQSYNKKNIEQFKFQEMSNFIDKYDFHLILPEEIIVPALCIITKLSKHEIHVLTNNKISKQSIDKFRELAKIQLCKLSIKYEHGLTKGSNLSEAKTSMSQIESKKYSSGFSSMTAFFPSVKVILEKMKLEQQPILQKNIIFCSCGGMIKIEHTLWQIKQNLFYETNIIDISTHTPLMVVEGYQFSGSFLQLKQLLNMPEHTTLISKEFRRACTCTKSCKLNNNTSNIEEIMLTNSTHHSQFITGAEIDWKGLGLENSDLKKEYDHLKTIPGCSIDDMSQFCIRHIYPSTIADVLKEQEEMKARLQAEKK